MTDLLGGAPGLREQGFSSSVQTELVLRFELKEGEQPNFDAVGHKTETTNKNHPVLRPPEPH